MPELKNEMKNTKRFNLSNTFLVVVLIATLFGASCRSKATHLTQNLENSRVPGQQSTQTPEGTAQTPGQETGQVQSPTMGIDSTATSISIVATQGASATLPPIQTPTSSSVVISPTATKKNTTPQAGTSTQVVTLTRTPTQTRTSTPTLTATATPTKTATLTQTPTLQTGWAGEWIAYLAQPNGSYKTGELIVTVLGDSVTGVFNNDGTIMNLSGIFSDEQIIVSGDYISPSANGYFKWVIRENSYLNGNIDNEWAFCAARAGLPQPDPCAYLDPS